MAGPLAAVIGVSVTQYGAAALIIVATALALIPRDVRAMRSDDQPSGARWTDELPELAGDLVGGGARC